MKAKQMLLTLTILTICLFTNAQDKLHCAYEGCDFEQGEVVFLFGHQVQLREAPTPEAKVLKTLPIGTHMVIMQKHENSWRYKGIDSHYYKVDYKGTEGYVLGGLLALEKKTIKGVSHLFGRAKIGDVDHLLIRTVQANGSFTEKSLRLGNTQFYLSSLGTKGLPDIDGILLVDYIAEGCGVEGGGIYLFQAAGKLHTVARLSQVSDAGAYYHWEEFIFPDDDYGVTGKIRYKKEVGENYDEVADWQKKSTETKLVVWSQDTLGLAQQ